MAYTMKCRRKMTRYKCSQCGEERSGELDELNHEGCEETDHGVHLWSPEDVEQVGTFKRESEDSEENDDWRTTHSDELKRQRGLEQVDGVVWSANPRLN